jgi:hypothetical protein
MNGGDSIPENKIKIYSGTRADANNYRIHKPSCQQKKKNRSGIHMAHIGTKQGNGYWNIIYHIRNIMRTNTSTFTIIQYSKTNKQSVNHDTFDVERTTLRY